MIEIMQSTTQKAKERIHVKRWTSKSKYLQYWKMNGKMDEINEWDNNNVFEIIKDRFCFTQEAQYIATTVDKNNLDQNYHWKTANIVLTIVVNGERLKVFPLRSETKQGWSLSPVPFNTILGVLARPLRQLKKRHTNWKDAKLLLFKINIIYYIKNHPQNV